MYRFLLLLPIFLYGISLDELVQSALENNSIIHKSRLDREFSQAKREEAKAKKFGEVNLVGSYTHYNLPRTLAPIVPSSLSPNSKIETTNDLFSTGVQYTVPLFTGGALSEQIKIEQLGERMAESRAKLSREELIYNVRSLYLSGLSLNELIEAQNSYIEALQNLKSIITQSVELGKKARIDILKSDDTLKEAEGRVSKLKNSLNSIKSTLQAVTHIEELNYFEPISVTIDSSPPVVDEDIEGLARFKLQDMQIARGKRVISKTKALKQPQANLNSYIGYNYDIDSSLNREYLWQIGVNLKWNIFDFGLRDSKLEQAKVSKLKAIVQREGVAEGFKKLLSKAIKQIDDAIVNYQTNLSKLNLLEESEKIEEARYGAGVATLNDLLLAKAKRELAKSKLIESKYSYQNGIFYLDYLFERGERE